MFFSTDHGFANNNNKFTVTIGSLKSWVASTLVCVADWYTFSMLTLVLWNSIYLALPILSYTIKHKCIDYKIYNATFKSGRQTDRHHVIWELPFMKETKITVCFLEEYKILLIRV